MFCQGSLRTTQNIGDILKQRWTGLGQFFIDLKTMPDAAFLCAVPDKLVKGSGLENAYEVLDYLARGPPTDFFLDLFGGTVSEIFLFMPILSVNYPNVSMLFIFLPGT